MRKLALGKIALLLLPVLTFGCKSRGWSESQSEAGLQAAGDGLSETDRALAELEVTECSQMPEGLCGSDDGTALMNPSQQELQFAYSKMNLDFRLNPYDLGSPLGSDPNVMYALTGKSNEFGATSGSAQLDQVAGAWTGFSITAGQLHRTPSVAAAVEVLIRGVLGDEVLSNPNALVPERFVASLEKLAPIFEQYESGSVTEDAVRQQISTLHQAGGFGHPTLDRLASGVTQTASESGGLNLETGFGQSIILGFTEFMAITRWYDQNLVAANQKKKAELIIAIKGLIPQIKQLEAVLLKHQITEQAKLAILDTLRILAGQDGYINHGDLPRILPVVPNLVGQVADKKINQGLADGIAQLRASKPFVYKRWARRPNGLIGRVVNKEINRGLSQAYAAKLKAINQASAQVQSVFNEALRRVGTNRHFLLVDSSKNYYDPATPLELSHIDRVVRAITGRSVLSVAESAASGQKAGNARIESMMREIEVPMTSLFQQVELPDGIFIEEALELAKKQVNQKGGLVLPEKLQFVLANNGKIRIGRRRVPCTCEYVAKVNRCVFWFNPHAEPMASTDKRYYQPLGGKLASVNGKPACEDYQQCAIQFGRKDFKYHIPYACGGYFWTKPGEVLYTAK